VFNKLKKKKTRRVRVKVKVRRQKKKALQTVATENTPSIPVPIKTEKKLSKTKPIASTTEIVEEEMEIDQPIQEKPSPQVCPIDCLNCGS